MHAATDFEEEKNELHAVLASGIFNRAPNLANVLTYVCEKHFEGAASQIKEYNVAVEALGRPPGFDQKRDSIVRVEAHRLRKRLSEYYGAQGASHTVRIDIPSGQYAPRFVRQIPAVPSPIEEAPPPPDPSPAGNDAGQSNGHAVAPILSPIAFAPARPLLLAPPTKRTASWVTLILAGLALAGLLIWRFPSTKPVKVAPPVPTAVVSGPAAETRILAGLQSGSYTDRFGKVWESDHYFAGGSVFESASHHIVGTHDARLFRSRREGAFTYDIPLTPGVYEMRLYFAETLYGENNVAGGGETSRIFNISANGRPLLSDFDVIGEVGASAADIRAFKDISPASDGKLHLRFEPKTNPAIISAIEITPGIRGKLTPIRLVSRDHPYTDRAGPNVGS